MYPNPQDVLPLPARPDVEQYRTRAKELVRASREGSDAIDTWAQRWIAALAKAVPDDAPAHAREAERRAKQVADFARERFATDAGALSQAQFVMARAHGFPSWTKLMQFSADTTGAGSPSALFERAADAIVRGEIEVLRTLLDAHPALVHAVSEREHGATLLHYVSANGVENFRQRTPANIVEIARLLLDAGADVNAECDVYGGGAQTLMLVVTSAHPRAMGVQIALADLLMARGATVGPSVVRDCLANGCPEAAGHMGAICLARGMRLQLQELAGMGRADLMELHAAQVTATPREQSDALQMAAWYDRLEAIAWLLDHGTPVDIPAHDGGATALHVASYAGNPAVVSLLLARGASVHARDTQYETTPLVWALHAWLVENRTSHETYRRIVRALLDAGAAVKLEWVDDDRVREDAQLYAALLERAGGG